MEYEDIERPAPQLMARVSPIATSTYANALDESKLFDNIMSGIASAATGFKLSGPAITIKLGVGEPGTYKIGRAHV